MKIRRKRYEQLMRIAETRVILDVPAGAILDVSFEQMYLIAKYAGMDGLYTLNISDVSHLLMTVKPGVTLQVKNVDPIGKSIQHQVNEAR